MTPDQFNAFTFPRRTNLSKRHGRNLSHVSRPRTGACARAICPLACTAAPTACSPKRKAQKVFVVNKMRPNIAVSETMCIACAASVTGQTNALKSYIDDIVIDAHPIDSGKQIVDGGILTTSHNRCRGNLSNCSVFFFERPTGAMAS